MAMSTILGCIKKADTDYNLINDGDRIAVGISGGKDSMCLVEALRLYRFFSKKNYEIVAIHINMGFPNEDCKEISEYLSKQGIELQIIDSCPLIYEVLKLNLTNSNRLPCSICGKMRKAAICKAAHQFNCSKVAFAHHGEDAIETFVMNAIYGGRLATFKPKMHLSKEDIIFIRPLIYAREKDIKNTIKTSKIPILPKICPQDGNTEREEIKQLLSSLYRKYPEARNNFLTMLSNSKHRELWEKENEE